MNQMYYSMHTDPEVIRVLEEAHKQRTRLRIWTYFARSQCGYIGSSSGPRMRLPILIPSSRTNYGLPIPTERILRIEHSNKRNGGVLYRRPDFHEVTR